MLNKWDIPKEVKSLDKLINELSIDIVVEKQRNAQSSSKNELLKEMEEALFELRQTRGLSHLMNALDKQKEPAWSKRVKRRTSH